MSNSQKNEVQIYLMFYDFEIHPDEISKLLHLKPTKSGLKGEDYFIGSKKKIKRKYKSNRWEFRKDCEIGEQWVQEFIDEFILEIIEPRKKEISEVISKGD